MDAFEKRLNTLLVSTFHHILRVEEGMLRTTKSPLSMSEIHLLDVVGEGSGHGRTISAIAEELHIAMPSVTVAVNKLARGGYLQKEKSPEDRRSVRITITKEGERIYRMHQYYHRKMVQAVSSGLTEEEKKVMLTGVQKLGAFFQEKAVEVDLKK